MATAAVVSLHAALLLFKLDGFAPGRVLGAHVLAVRPLPFRALDVAKATSPTVEPIPEPPHREQAHVDAASPALDSRKPQAEPERPVPVPRPARSAADPAPPDAARTPASTALPPQPDYLAGAGLDPGPRPLGDIEPEYPESAHLQEGMVVLRVLISETGRVDDVAVVRAEPKGVLTMPRSKPFVPRTFFRGCFSACR